MRRALTGVLAAAGLLLILQAPVGAGAFSYTVVPGDSLFRIGQLFGVGVSNLALYNGLASDRIVAGQVLAIPGVSHAVQPGDSLFLLARRYGTTVEALRRLNGLASDRIQAGQALWIPGLTAHAVRPGDSLFLLARRYGTTVEELRRLNALPSDLLLAGQTLAVPIAALPAPILTSDEVYLLAQMIHAEAEAELYLGKVAVGAVILNRIRSPLFPDTLRGVLFQPGQFEPVMNGWFWRPPGQEALRAARDAAGGWDPSGGALYFYNPAKSTSRWIFTRPVIVRIGNHVFAY